MAVPARRSEALLFAIRRALLKDYAGIKLTPADARIVSDYFREGCMILSPAEYAKLKSDPCNFNKGVAVIPTNNQTMTEREIKRLGGPELMQIVDIKYRVGVRCT